MSTENGGDSPLQLRLQSIERHFSKGYKLDQDSINVWAYLVFVTNPEKTKRLKPLEHYEDYIRRINTSDEVYKCKMKLSNPETAATFDQLVDEFNADLERMVTEQDFATAQNFMQRARELVDQKR